MTTERKKYDRDDIHKITLEYFKGDTLATDVWINKYCLQDNNGNFYEQSPEDMHIRIASELYRMELKYPNPTNFNTILESLRNFERIIPQGSPMAGIGNDYQVMSIGNCFVVGNPDNSDDSYSAVFTTDQKIAQLQKRRAGVGVTLDNIRPDGSKVNNAAKKSTGIVPYMERYSNTTREVAQGGRRGALMQALSIIHPQAEDFIDAKMDTTKVTGANVSVKITDKFMQAVIDDTMFMQQFPIYSEKPTITNEINAKKLWDKIIFNAHKSAEPGVLFWDKIISESPADCYAHLGFRTISTNPCVTFDTWVMTDNGPMQVSDLIGKSFTAITAGRHSRSTSEGFFITGDKQVFEVKTKRGFTVKATADHPFRAVDSITRKDVLSSMKKLEDILPGQKIVLNNNRGLEWGNNNTTFNQGWLLGSLVGDGTITEDNAILQYWGETKDSTFKFANEALKLSVEHRSDMGSGSAVQRDSRRIKSKGLLDLASKYGINRDKTINEKLISLTSSDFYRGFIAGWIDADGTVTLNKEKGSSIRLASTILTNLQIAQRMLARLGIMSTIYENRKPEGKYDLPNGKGGKVNVDCEAYHELHIAKDNIKEFSNQITLSESYKNENVKAIINSASKRGLYRERFVDEIISITPIGIETVADCTVYPDHQFDANGFIVSNCGELPLPSGDSCRLLLLNLFAYVKNAFTAEAYFDFEMFATDVKLAQRYMDDIVDLELEKIEKIITKIKSDPETDEVKAVELNMWLEVKEKCTNGRRTGTGITGEGDMLAAMNLIYGTEEATAFAVTVHEQLAYNAYMESVNLAKERGYFPIFDPKLELNNPYLNRLKEKFPDLGVEMIKYGRRNIALLTIAPAGSVSILTKTTSGIEPVFMVSYKRRRKVNPNDKRSRVDFVDETGDSWEEYYVFHHHFKTWMEANGYDSNEVSKLSEIELNELIKKSPYYGATANDVNWVEKVKMQAAIQKTIDHSISVTVNVPENTTVEMVNDIYVTAWKFGCKGCTIYRDGSRSGVLIADNKEEAQKEEIKEELFRESHAPKRPKYLECDVIRFMNKGHKWIGFIGLLDNRPYEVFSGPQAEINIASNVDKGKIRKTKHENEHSSYDFMFNDGDKEVEVIGLNSMFDKETHDISRMISAILRHGMPLSYVIQLIDSLNLDGDLVNTWKNGVKRMIKKYVNDGTVIKKQIPANCPEPEKAECQLEFREGCLTCTKCGNSKCN